MRRLTHSGIDGSYLFCSRRRSQADFGARRFVGPEPSGCFASPSDRPACFAGALESSVCFSGGSDCSRPCLFPRNPRARVREAPLRDGSLPGRARASLFSLPPPGPMRCLSVFPPFAELVLAPLPAAPPCALWSPQVDVQSSIGGGCAVTSPHPTRINDTHARMRMART